MHDDRRAMSGRRQHPHLCGERLAFLYVQTFEAQIVNGDSGQGASLAIVFVAYHPP